MKPTHALLFVLLLLPCITQADVQTTVVGQKSETIFSAWNTNGALHFRIVDKENEPACVTVWWNRSGFNSDSFELCDRDTLDYKVRFYEYARLKARGSSNNIIVALSGSAAVTNNFDLCRILEC